MKSFTLLAIVALLTKESQQINLKWGVKDLEGDGTDSMFAHIDVTKEDELKQSMDSVREAE